MDFRRVSLYFGAVIFLLTVYVLPYILCIVFRIVFVNIGFSGYEERMFGERSFAITSRNTFIDFIYAPVIGVHEYWIGSEIPEEPEERRVDKGVDVLQKP